MVVQRFAVGALVNVVGLDTYDGVVIRAEWDEFLSTYRYAVAHTAHPRGMPDPVVYTKFWNERSLAPGHRAAVREVA